MKKKLLSVLICAAMAVTMLSACGKAAEPAAEEPAKEEPAAEEPAAEEPAAEEPAAEEPAAKADGDITVGFSSKGNKDAFVKAIVDAAQAEADARGIKLVVTDAESDINKQISDVESLITQQVDALIVIPQDIEGSAPVVGMAHEADIPIIVCNGDIADTSYTAFVGCTDQESGEILGTWMMENLEENSKVCIIEGPMGQSGQVGRYAGFKAVGALDYFDVLAVQTANWQRAEAMSLTEDWLTTYGDDLKGILAENDDMALGALSACKAAGRTDIIIGGVDGLPDAVEAIQAGEIGVSVLQDSNGQGAGSVDVAIKIAKGESFEKDTRIPFKAITKENVEAYVKDGVSALD